jgi:diguanylate cyclase (GGDEF)-like protein/PAS domain S-box-containing protein
MPPPVRALRRVASQAFEGLVAAPVVLALHEFGWGGTAPLWLLLGSLVLAQASTNEDLQRRLGGPDLTRHTQSRLALQIGLGTSFMYLLGWGPVLTSALTLVLANHLKWGVNAEIWRPMLGWSVAAICGGQAAIAAGAVHSYVDTPGAHALAVLNVLLLFLLMRLLGVVSAERLSAEQAVRTNEQRFRALVQNSTDVVLITDAHAVPIYVSPSIMRVTGRSQEEVRGADPFALVHPDDRAGLEQMLAAVVATPGAERELELRVLHGDNTWHWVETYVRNLLDEPSVGGLVINFRDTTERRELENRLRHQAFHDPMTGLPNRAMFMDRLDQAGARQEHRGTAPIVMLIDVDDFKAINDSLGHLMGDELLVQVATSLRTVLPPAATLARLGGDEFAVMIEGLADPSEVESWAEQVLAAIQRDFQLGEHRLPVTASIGVSACTGAPTTPGELLRDADLAMYVAKAAGKGRFAIYETGMAQAMHSRLQLKIDLVDALAVGDQMVLDYQPVIELRSGRVVGVEALLRWNHPRLGQLLPGAFLPLAEESGLIVPLSRWVLLHACQQLATWQQSSPSFQDVAVGVNVSMTHVWHPGLLEDLDRSLLTTGIHPTRLVLEIKETALAHEAARSGGVLQQIRARGVQIAVDDFGASSSSLASLRDVPIDIIKIDKGFGTDAKGGNSAHIAQGIVELAHRLSLPVVAQGIESLGAAESLRAIDCAYAQGTLFARPTDPASITAFVTRFNKQPGPPRTPLAGGRLAHSGGEQHRAAEGAATVAGDGDVVTTRLLACPTLAAQLDDRLVHEAEAVQPPG